MCRITTLQRPPRMAVHRWIGVWGLLIGLTVACSPPPEDNELIALEPDFVGFITMIQPVGSSGETGNIVVESHADKLVRRHVVEITGDTVILKRTNASEHRVSFASLELKNWVKVWFSGQARKSYPREVTARKLVIVDRL